MRSLIVTFAFGLLVAAVHADDWPQWLGPQRDGVWRETGLLDKLPSKPKVRWRVPLGAGYAGPAVVGGKIYVLDRQLPKGAQNPNNPFKKDVVNGTDRVVCLDESNGKEIWKHEYPSRVRSQLPRRAADDAGSGRRQSICNGHDGRVVLSRRGQGDRPLVEELSQRLWSDRTAVGLGGQSAIGRRSPDLPGRRQGAGRRRVSQRHRQGTVAGARAPPSQVTVRQ